MNMKKKSTLHIYTQRSHFEVFGLVKEILSFPKQNNSKDKYNCFKNSHFSDISLTFQLHFLIFGKLQIYLYRKS